jgi:hypothetical protein
MSRGAMLGRDAWQLVPQRQLQKERSMTSDAQREEWLAALDCDQETRIVRMLARYSGLGDLAESALEARLDTIIRAEYGLDDAALRSLTAARLQAWLRLAGANIELARRLGRAYDRVFARLPGALEFRRAVASQTVATHELSAAQRMLLADVVPGFARSVPPTSGVA